MARINPDRMMIDGGEVPDMQVTTPASPASVRMAEERGRVAAPSTAAFPEDIALSARVTAAPAVTVPVFASTGDIFKDTLNNLRAARGITPKDINALGQLDVYGVTEQRIADAQAVAAKPVMSAEQKAGGGVVKWVGGINGEYQIIMPTGSALIGSKAAGWEPGRNRVNGTPTATTTTTTTTTTPTTTVTTPTTTVTTPTTVTTNPSTTVVTGTGFNTTGLSTEQIDAVAGIKAFLSSLGIGDLSDAITNAIKRGYTTDTIKLIMQDPNSTDPLSVAFQKRFPANKERLAAGKPAIDAADYLRAERAYAQIFQSYGVSNLANNALMSSFIAGDVSATEVSDRIALAVNRVQNADANTKAILKANYPELTTGDIVGAMLNPKDGLPALQRKVQIAEIGGAALAQKLNTSLADTTRASDLYGNVTTGSLGLENLASLGITKEQAQAGFAKIADIAPRSEFLSSITGGEDYTRLQAEQEVFGGLASAKRAREKLSETEVGRFSGKAGTIGSKSFGQTRAI